MTMARTSKQKSKFQRAMEHSVLGPALFFTLPASVFLPGFYGIMLARFDSGAQEEIEGRIEEIIHAQEQRLGITYSEKPRVAFESQAWMKPNPIFYVRGKHDPRTDTIYLNPENNLYGLLTGLFSPENWQGTLEHELGHFYVNKQAKELGICGSVICADTEHNRGLKVVGEGIGEYFRRKGTREERDEFSNGKISGSFLDLREPYDGGYHLVKPILDYDLKRGVNYLITHPPTEQDLDNIQAYQRRALDVLKRTDKV